MSKLLYITACVRDDSRTAELTKTYLEGFSGEMEEVRLESLPLAPLKRKSLEMQNAFAQNKQWDDPMFLLAKQFRECEQLLVSAPYWHLSFPALLRTYFENVCVCGLTFRYSPEGRPLSLCRLNKLTYITTSGGIIGEYNFGFNYLKALCGCFYGVKDFEFFSAEGLDIKENDAGTILEEAKKKIRKRG